MLKFGLFENHLALDPADYMADGSEHRCEDYIDNTNLKLMFYIQQKLPAGEDMKLEVCNKINNKVKDVKKGRFGIVLGVF